MGAETLLGLVSAHLSWSEWSVKSLACGKCLQNLESIYLKEFFFLPNFSRDAPGPGSCAWQAKSCPACFKDLSLLWDVGYGILFDII